MKSIKVKTLNGVTLVELLVVITILVLVVGVVLPLAQPVLRSRGVREASRQINAFFAAAQARAMSDGRSYGVMLIRDPNDPTGSRAYELVMVKSSAVYAGDVPNAYSSRVKYGLPKWQRGWRHTLHGAYRAEFSSADTKPFLISGDLIRLGYRGPHYRIVNFAEPQPPEDGSTPSLPANLEIQFVPATQASNVFPNAAVQDVSPPVGGADLPFQIIRHPRRTAAAPLVLPQGTFVDLQFSGVGSDLVPSTGVLVVPDVDGDGVSKHFDDDDTNPGVRNANGRSELVAAPIIMFNSDGSVGRFYGDIDVTDNGIVVGPPNPHMANDTIHLLISRPMKDGLDSLSQDAESLWVSISQKTGRVSTYQNLGASPGGSTFARALQARQASTKSAQVVGGR